MSITVQCPNCQTATRIPEKAFRATCPKCLATYSARGDDAPPQPGAVPGRKGQDTPSVGTWVNPYGAVSLALATLALLSANLVAERMVTIVLVSLGLLVVAIGLVARKANRKDWGWFALGGALNGLVLFVVLVRPGLLNSFWGLDVAADEPDPQQLIVVPRTQPRAPGKPLTADDWANATSDAIRQGKVLVRIESVKSGLRGGISCLQIQLQIANLGADVITIAGFGGAGLSSDKNAPTLTDGSGRSFAFLKRQKRTKGPGGPAPPAFEDVGDQAVELKADDRHDLLLLFEAPSSRVENLKLEAPASAWGRDGRCKFHIAGLFAAY